jgi:UDP-N-acetylmuramate--alanine ligase
VLFTFSPPPNAGERSKNATVSKGFYHIKIVQGRGELLERIDKLRSILSSKGKTIHFVGIGGSGMFPIAKIINSQGFKVTGSDIYESDTLGKIRELGIDVALDHKPENIKNCDALVYSAAIKTSNPEIAEAQSRNIPVIERCELLGLISEKYDNFIGVSGTHGKTTTTSIITHILLDANKNPSAIIGGTLKKLNGNSCEGSSDIFVCEACEYVDSFLQLYPKFTVILNLEADHLDYFKTFENMKKSFKKFAFQTKDTIIYNGDDSNIIEILNDIDKNKISFGFSENNDYVTENILMDKNGSTTFDLTLNGKLLGKISLNIPGKHNIYNAVAGIIVCLNLGVEFEDIKRHILGFKGAHRRFEILGNPGGILIVDDFAHHPTEIKSTLVTAKNMKFNKIWAIFQPHTYSRTFMFLDDFAKALSIADEVILTEILPVRETNIYDIYSKDLAAKMRNCICIDDFDKIAEFILNNARKGDIVITMGGGNIYKCANIILGKLTAVSFEKRHMSKCPL